MNVLIGFGFSYWTLIAIVMVFIAVVIIWWLSNKYGEDEDE